MRRKSMHNLEPENLLVRVASNVMEILTEISAYIVTRDDQTLLKRLYCSAHEFVRHMGHETLIFRCLGYDTLVGRSGMGSNTHWPAALSESPFAGLTSVEVFAGREDAGGSLVVVCMGGRRRNGYTLRPVT